MTCIYAVEMNHKSPSAESLISIWKLKPVGLLESWKFETSLLLRYSLCAFTLDLISWKIKDNDERTFQNVVSNQISRFRKHTFSGFPAIQLLKNQRLTWSGIFVNTLLQILQLKPSIKLILDAQSHRVERYSQKSTFI